MVAEASGRQGVCLNSESMREACEGAQAPAQEEGWYRQHQQTSRNTDSDSDPGPLFPLAYQKAETAKQCQRDQIAKTVYKQAAP